MITIPILALIGQFVLILIAFLTFGYKFMARIGKIESRLDASDIVSQTLRNDFISHSQYVKEEFAKIGGSNEKIMNKLDELQKGVHSIELEVVGIKAELKFKNGNKSENKN